MADIKTQFMKKVHYEHWTKCWEWLGGPGFDIFDRTYDPQRASWHIHDLGPGYGKREILNKDSCTTSPCVNPMHMSLGDEINPETWQRDANRDPRAKLTEEAVRDIRYAYDVLGESQSSLAELYGVTQQNIHAVVNRKTWVEVRDDWAQTE